MPSIGLSRLWHGVTEEFRRWKLTFVHPQHRLRSTGLRRWAVRRIRKGPRRECSATIAQFSLGESEN